MTFDLGWTILSFDLGWTILSSQAVTYPVVEGICTTALVHYVDSSMLIVKECSTRYSNCRTRAFFLGTCDRELRIDPIEQKD